MFKNLTSPTNSKYSFVETENSTPSTNRKVGDLLKRQLLKTAILFRVD